MAAAAANANAAMAAMPSSAAGQVPPASGRFRIRPRVSGEEPEAAAAAEVDLGDLGCDNNARKNVRSRRQ